ncbi:MAG: hypothetical protein C4547_02470 [Phycisphaerales bacterium]|nr:MAG: hypothetical protein C4547_02470 [Phycisphaerales bacterium]
MSERRCDEAVTVRRRILVAASLALTPLLLGWGYSVLVRPIYFVGRYDCVAWPGFILLLALVIDTRLALRVADAAPARCRPSGRRLHWWIVAGMMACGTVPLARYLTSTSPPLPAWHRQRAEWLAESAAAGDMALVLSYDAEYLTYHLDQAGFQGRLVTFPTWLEGQIGWIDTAADLSDEARLSADAETVAARLTDALAAGRAMWWLKDSQPPDSPRTAVNAHLERRLRDAGYVLEARSREYLIYEMRAGFAGGK